jgi:hypothetical protein
MATIIGQSISPIRIYEWDLDNEITYLYVPQLVPQPWEAWEAVVVWVVDGCLGVRPERIYRS